MTQLESVRNIVRVAGVATAVLSGSMGFASAAPSGFFTGSNDVTGPSSFNSNVFTVSHMMSTTLNNNGFVSNFVNPTVVTGGNQLLNNTSVGSFTSGAANVTGQLNNQLNSGAVAGLGMVGSGVAGMVSASFANGTTGPNSSNVNSLSHTSTVTNTVNNNATLSNNVSVNLTTGNNRVDSNTLVGNVRSGSSTVNLGVSNSANAGAAAAAAGLLSASTPATVTVQSANTFTGPNSSNENRVNVSDSQTTNVTNTSNLTNSFTVNANSGNNTTSNNTSVGDVTSGDQNVSLNITNTAN